MTDPQPSTLNDDSELRAKFQECFDNFGHDVVNFGDKENARVTLSEKYIQFLLQEVHQRDEARDRTLLKRVADYANGMKLDTILVNTQYSSDSVEMHEAAARNEALAEIVTFIEQLTNPEKSSE